MTPKKQLFVREYLIDLNATQAAIRCGYSAKTAYSQGQRLLKDVEIGAAVQAAMSERAARTEITADNVLKELWAIATADAAELIEYQVRCCRYCWGIGHHYQHSAREIEKIEASAAAAEERGEEPQQVDVSGGSDWDPRRPPNPACPECFGEGHGKVRLKDTARYGPGGKALYAGVKIGKDGIEVKMHDRAAALVQVGKHLGMFKDQVEHGGNLTVTIAGPDADL